MLPSPPAPTSVALKRAEALPLAYWQHVGDPLADLLSTIYPIDDADTLQSLLAYEAEQGQVLCAQLLAQGQMLPAHWHDPKFAHALTAWKDFTLQYPLAVRLAWQAGAGMRLISQLRWTRLWSGTTGLQAFMQRIDDLLLAPALPSPEQVLGLRLALAILRRDAEQQGAQAEAGTPAGDAGVPLAQTDLACLISCLSEELARCLQGLGTPLNRREREGLRHWAAGLGQALCLEPVWLAGSEDEARALHQVLLAPPAIAAGTQARHWLRCVAASDPLPAAGRRTLALARSLLDPLVADTLGLPRDTVAGLWRRASGWLVEKGRPLAGQSEAVRHWQARRIRQDD